MTRSREATPPNVEPASSDAEEGALSSFERSTERLSEIVELLERGELPLEQALQAFEEGVKLLRSAENRLSQAERRVEELLGFDTKGRPVTRELALGRTMEPGDDPPRSARE